MNNQKVAQKIEHTRPVLKEFLKESQINRFIQEAKEFSNIVISKYPNYKSKTTNSFMEKGVFALSVYKILLKYISKENALQTTQKCFYADVDNTFKSPIFKALNKSKAVLRLTRKIMVKDANTHDGNLGFKYELNSMDKNHLYRFKVTKCPLVELLKKYEAFELAPYLCKADFYVLKYYPKDVALVRPKEIGKGDDCCDCNYIYKN